MDSNDIDQVERDWAWTLTIGDRRLIGIAINRVLGLSDDADRRRRRRRTGWVIALAMIGMVAIGLMVAATAITVVRRLDRPAVTPAQTIDTFLTTAFSNNDVAAALALVCADHRPTIQIGLQRSIRVTKDFGTRRSWQILGEEIHGIQATVTVSMITQTAHTSLSGSIMSFFNLRIEHDAWLIYGWI